MAKPKTFFFDSIIRYNHTVTTFNPAYNNTCNKRFDYDIYNYGYSNANDYWLVDLFHTSFAIIYV